MLIYNLPKNTQRVIYDRISKSLCKEGVYGDMNRIMTQHKMAMDFKSLRGYIYTHDLKLK